MAAGHSPEWLNQNSTRAFPLAENASRLDTTGTIVLPDSLLVAAQVNATQDYDKGIFYLSQVTAVPDEILLTVSYLADTGASREIATVSVVVVTHAENKNYAFTGQGEDSSVFGSLTIGALYETLASIPGPVQFSASATPFEINALFFSVPAMKQIQLYNGNNFVKAFGDVLKLRPGSNIRLTYIGDDTIRIDAIAGENLVEPEDCANAIPKPPPIRTINGVGGDSSGNLQLEGSSCISVDPSARGLAITDLCAKSCCGCDELVTIVDGLQRVEAQILTMEGRVASVNEQQADMLAKLVANLQA